MDYNTSELDSRINVFRTLGDERKRDLLLLYQVRLEYLQLFLLGYLWNKNLSKLDANSKEYVFGKIGRPSIGDLIHICRKLDVEHEVFGNHSRKASLDAYPNIRNRYLGHGYTLDDGIDESLEEFKRVNDDISLAGSES